MRDYLHYRDEETKDRTCPKSQYKQQSQPGVWVPTFAHCATLPLWSFNKAFLSQIGRIHSQNRAYIQKGEVRENHA